MTMETGTPDVLFEQRAAVGWLTFNRPDKRNAMTWEMYAALRRLCDYVESEPTIRVLVLRGAGDRAFVAGTDIGQFQSFTEPQDALDYEQRMDGIIGRLETLNRPTIALLRGFAVGGGATIALSCDLRLATPDARLGIPIARTLGNCLSMNNYARLVDLMGPARAKELIFTARLLTADEAAAMGLINEIVAPESIDERVAAMAEQIASHAPLTLQITKEAIRRVLAHRRPPHENDLVLKAYLSDDFREGVRAFLEKRPPQWQGR
jgi:enoyl-CoA hydratase/carnithine racemase